MLYFYATTILKLSAERVRIEQVQALASAVGIKSDINLCDDRTPKAGNSYNVNGTNYTVEIPDYYESIINNNSVLYVGNKTNGYNGNGYIPNAKLVYYNSNSEIFGQWFKEVSDFINNENNSAPFQIHCEIGVDRTGVFCAVLAGLCGATLEQIANDYILSNKMYINEFRDIRILKYSLENMLGIEDISIVENLKTSLYNYFTSNGFVSSSNLDSVVTKLTH